MKYHTTDSKLLLMIDRVKYYLQKNHNYNSVSVFEDSVENCLNDDDIKCTIIETTMTLFGQDVLSYESPDSLIPSIEDLEQDDSDECINGNWVDRLMTLYVLEMHSNDTNETMYNYFVGAFPFIMMNDKSKFSSISDSE
jgi:hypothetical protein